ncbi:hypothetical protein T01_524, partial [Trichinella spiralis]
MLLTKSGESSLMLQIGFFNVTADLGKFTLTLLINFNLRSGSTPCFVQSFTKISQIARKK